MQSRMKNPAMILPDALQALLALSKAAEKRRTIHNAQTRPPARQPDQWLQRLRGHACSRA
jgi:hypothetical protein